MQGKDRKGEEKKPCTMCPDTKKTRQSKGFCPTCNEHRCCCSNETCTSFAQSCNFRYILSIASQPKTTNLNEP